MKQTRQYRAKLNIVVSLLTQAVAVLCGFVLPRTLINAFGSEAYGATASIAQFLAYITLLEGGIGGVARAALYKPLADNNAERISGIVAELRRFFRILAWVFAVYVLILACTYTYLAKITVFDWTTTFLLVLIIAISTFAQHYIGITASVLLQAAQRNYITNLVSSAATVLNVAISVVMVHSGYNLLAVKLASSIIFILRPVVLWMYVNRKFRLTATAERDKAALSQKWSGLGQHLAFFLHNNTDIMVLTLFADLKLVAVYSVYNMIISHIVNFASSFTSGMEAVFGDMLAKQEHKELNKSFSQYETMVSAVAVVLLTSTAILIMPFIKLYTAGITDAQYNVPMFAYLMVVASLLQCLRMPYHSVVIAAGHFRQTQAAAYGEALLNIALSVLLVSRYGLIGVALGTVIATGLRFLYYVWYLEKNVLLRRIAVFVKRFAVNTVLFAALLLLGTSIIGKCRIESYFDWFIAGAVTVLSCTLLTALGNALCYKNDVLAVVRRKTKKMR